MSISVPQDGMTDLIEINEFPTELKLALKGLNNENRQKILLALLPHVKLSFADIQKTANVKKTLVPNHLDVLVKNLHWIKDELDNNTNGFKLFIIKSGILKIPVKKYTS